MLPEKPLEEKKFTELKGSINRSATNVGNLLSGEGEIDKEELAAALTNFKYLDASKFDEKASSFHNFAQNSQSKKLAENSVFKSKPMLALHIETCLVAFPRQNQEQEDKKLQEIAVHVFEGLYTTKNFMHKRSIDNSMFGEHDKVDRDTVIATAQYISDNFELFKGLNEKQLKKMGAEIKIELKSLKGNNSVTDNKYLYRMIKKLKESSQRIIQTGLGINSSEIGIGGTHSSVRSVNRSNSNRGL